MKALTYLLRFYGFGYTRSKMFIQKFGLKSNLKLDKKFMKRFLIEDRESEIKFEKKKNIEILKKLKTFKGEKHTKNLPVNGQRTKTNAKTRKKFKII